MLIYIKLFYYNKLTFKKITFYKIYNELSTSNLQN